jgi:hypothetical protein
MLINSGRKPKDSNSLKIHTQTTNRFYEFHLRHNQRHLQIQFFDFINFGKDLEESFRKRIQS